MLDTLKEFWQMIAENDAKTILMLCDLFEGGKVMNRDEKTVCVNPC